MTECNVFPPKLHLRGVLEKGKLNLCYFLINSPDGAIDWTWAVNEDQLKNIGRQNELVFRMRQELYIRQALLTSVTDEIADVLSELEVEPKSPEQHEKLHYERTDRPRQLIHSTAIKLCEQEANTGNIVTAGDVHWQKARGQHDSWQILNRLRSACLGRAAENVDKEAIRVTYEAHLSLMFLYNSALISAAQPLFRLTLAKSDHYRRWHKPDTNQLFRNSQEQSVYLSNALVLGLADFKNPNLF